MKKIILTTPILLALVLSFVVLNAQNNFKIVDDLKKNIEFEDNLTGEEKELFEKCQNWELTEKEICEIFSKSKLSTSEEIHGMYYWLPCYYNTTIEYNNNNYTMEINAASFIVIYNDDETLYFGCDNEELRKYFVLEATCCEGE